MTKKKLDWNKPLETQEGYPAKVISDDYAHNGKTYRIVQITLPNGDSSSHLFRDDGRLLFGTAQRRNRKTKHEAWQNLYRDGGGLHATSTLYKSEELAREGIRESTYIATVKIDWEE